MNTSLDMPPPPKRKTKKSAAQKPPTPPKSSEVPKASAKDNETPVTSFRVHPDLILALKRRAAALNESGEVPGRATRSGVLSLILRRELKAEIEAIRAERAAGTLKDDDDEEKPS